MTTCTTDCFFNGKRWQNTYREIPLRNHLHRGTMMVHHLWTKPPSLMGCLRNRPKSSPRPTPHLSYNRRSGQRAPSLKKRRNRRVLYRIQPRIDTYMAAIQRQIQEIYPGRPPPYRGMPGYRPSGYTGTEHPRSCHSAQEKKSLHFAPPLPMASGQRED